MIKEGAMNNPKVDVIFAMHIMSKLEEGKLLYKEGPIMASSDRFIIKVKGKQSHGANPWRGVDPIAVGAQIINGLQQIVSRQLDLTRSPAVVSIGRVNSGVRYNIIPEELEMDGTIRTFDKGMKESIMERIYKISRGIAESNGATAEVSIVPGIPVTFNHVQLTRSIIPILKRTLGEENVQETGWSTGAEDFAYYGSEAPSLYLYYGGMPKGGSSEKSPPPHSSDFIISDNMLYKGVEVLCNIVLDYPKIHGSIK